MFKPSPKTTVTARPVTQIICPQIPGHRTTNKEGLKAKYSSLVPQNQFQFKICVLVNKCRHRAAPPYLSKMCVPVSTFASHCHLRSPAYYDLTVSRTRLKCYGQRSFASSSPTMWKPLPVTICDLLIVTAFCKQLKTELFHVDNKNYCCCYYYCYYRRVTLQQNTRVTH